MEARVSASRLLFAHSLAKPLKHFEEEWSEDNPLLARQLLNRFVQKGMLSLVVKLKLAQLYQTSTLEEEASGKSWKDLLRE